MQDLGHLCIPGQGMQTCCPACPAWKRQLACRAAAAGRRWRPPATTPLICCWPKRAPASGIAPPAAHSRHPAQLYPLPKGLPGAPTLDAQRRSACSHTSLRSRPAMPGVAAATASSSASLRCRAYWRRMSALRGMDRVGLGAVQLAVGEQAAQRGDDRRGGMGVGRRSS